MLFRKTAPVNEIISAMRGMTADEKRSAAQMCHAHPEVEAIASYAGCEVIRFADFNFEDRLKAMVNRVTKPNPHAHPLDQHEWHFSSHADGRVFQARAMGVGLNMAFNENAMIHSVVNLSGHSGVSNPLSRCANSIGLDLRCSIRETKIHGINIISYPWGCRASVHIKEVAVVKKDDVQRYIKWIDTLINLSCEVMEFRLRRALSNPFSRVEILFEPDTSEFLDDLNSI